MNVYSILTGQQIEQYNEDDLKYLDYIHSASTMMDEALAYFLQRLAFEDQRRLPEENTER